MRKHEKCEVCGRDTVVKCEKCGKDVCLEHVYKYIDESNLKLSKESPMLCKDCYIETYKIQVNGGEKIGMEGKVK